MGKESWKDCKNVELDPIFLVYAFRYALGRMTYAVEDVASALLTHKDNLPESAKGQMVDDIDHAIRNNQAGHQCDVDRWLEVREAFVGQVAEGP